jgi:hypothetical protein
MRPNLRNMTPHFLLRKRKKQTHSGNSDFWQAFDIERRLSGSMNSISSGS